MIAISGQLLKQHRQPPVRIEMAYQKWHITGQCRPSAARRSPRGIDKLITANSYRRNIALNLADR
jgi:hypothetical protein